MSITVYVPGKLMLLGEHVVVYGYPCIVSSVNKFLKVECSFSEKFEDIIDIPKGTDDQLIKISVNTFRNKFQKKDKLHIKTESEITGFGLGSSAAVTVGVMKALSGLYEITLSRDKLFNLSYQTIIRLQPRSSGFDIASCIWGGTILFTGEDKNVESLSDNLLPILVIFSGAKADTVGMVEKVAVLKKNEPEKTAEAFQSIGKIVEKGRIALSQKDWMGFGKLMNENHELLRSLGISNNILDNLVETCLKAGAFGAKISGAGGGDCIIAIAPEARIEYIKRAVNSSGGKIIDMNVGETKGALNS